MIYKNLSAVVLPDFNTLVHTTDEMLRQFDKRCNTKWKDPGKIGERIYLALVDSKGIPRATVIIFGNDSPANLRRAVRIFTPSKAVNRRTEHIEEYGSYAPEYNHYRALPEKGCVKHVFLRTYVEIDLELIKELFLLMSMTYGNS